MAGRSIIGRKTSRFGQDREKVRRIPFGLGQAPGDLKAAEKCLRCSFGNIPVIEQVVWTVPLPLTLEEATSTFGDSVNLLSGSSAVPGVQSIDSTFLINGILQTDILAHGVGVHVFCEPMSFSTIGNAFNAPTTTTAPPPSPDVFTTNDLTNGAMGATVTADSDNFSPAVFVWGVDVWRAGWNFINAYQFQWKTNQRELVLNELAADVSYFGSFADAEAAGTSEVAVIEFVASVNAQYRSKGSGTIFLPVNFRRVGSISTTSPVAGNIGIFHPTRDFDLAPVTWGGLRWQGYGCKGQMYRPVESPCFLERGIPIGMLFAVQDAVHQANMLQALTITNEPLGTNITPDQNINCGPTLSSATAMLEQTLDPAPVPIPQTVNVCREVFKGGILKLGIKIKGWEMPGGWKAFCQSPSAPPAVQQIMSPQMSA
jgi:hypothetical protein